MILIIAVIQKYALNSVRSIMKLSILIPVYNAGKYLKHCLDSIFSNINTEKIEVVLIDDGSTDNSLDIIKNYCHSIKFSSRVNKGVLYTRKELIHLATGEYVFYVDADDYIVNGGIDRVFELLQQSNYPDILFIDAYSDYNGVLKYDKYNSKLEKKLMQDIRTDFSLYKVNNALWGKIFKRELLADIVFDGKESEIFTGEDLLLTSFIMNKAKTGAYANEAIYVYRKDISNSITSFFRLDGFKSIDAVYSNIANNYIYFYDNKKNWLVRYLNVTERIFKDAIKKYTKKQSSEFKNLLDEIRKAPLFIEAKSCKNSFILWCIRRGFGLSLLRLGSAFYKIL